MVEDTDDSLLWRKQLLHLALSKARIKLGYFIPAYESQELETYNYILIINTVLENRELLTEESILFNP